LTPTFPNWEVPWLLDYLRKLSLTETLLVGWSLGGMLLLEALMAEPLKPAGLVLVATPASFCQRPDHPYGQPKIQVRGLRRKLREDSRRVLADFACRCLAPGESQFQEEILQDFQPQENGADLAAGLDYLLHTDLRPRLSHVQARALILQGDKDDIVPPAQAEVLRDYLNDAQVAVIPGAGHAPFLTRPEKVYGLMKEMVGGEGKAPQPLASAAIIPALK
jgi:pimeloyl-ACP methyl ester carboxylesterase